jgi:hypothetical protein
MGARTTYALVTPPKDEADERWRDVLFELLRRAHTDAEFRARVEASGAVIENLEAVIARHRADRMAPSGTIGCREYWWGFQLEIPHESLATWVIGLTEPADIADALGTGTGPSTPFRRRAAAWIANHLLELQTLDTGVGVCVSMTWMAPNIFIPTTIPRADR